MMEKRKDKIYPKLELNNLPGMVYQCLNDQFWTMKFVSEKSFELTGYTPDELIDNSVESYENLILPEFKSEVRKKWQDAVSNKADIALEYKIKTKDGKIKWVLEQGKAVCSKNGEVVFLEGFIGDITERKQAEAELHEKEAFLARSQEIAHTGSWKLELPANRLTWSDEVYRIFGFKPQEFAITYEIFLDLVHPDDRAAVDEAYSRSLRERRDGYEIEHRIVRRNSDEVRCVYERCVHERDAAGVIIQSTGMLRDITEQKKAEIELKKSDRIFNHSIDMLCIAGFDGYFKTLNPSWERVLGWSKGELLSKPWIEFTHPDDVEKTKNVKAIQLDNGDHVYHFENRYICKDGSVKWLSWNSFPYLEEKIMFGVARDITEQKKAEEELKDRERRLQQIFEILPIGLWFADETGKLVMGNPAGVKIWGAEPTVGIEEYGIFKARKLPENIEIIGEEWALAKTIKDGVIIADELLEIDALDGKKKIILNYTAPILDDESEVKGAIVINQEVTEKYKYEEKLKKSEEKYRLIAENMGNVVTMLDTNLNFTYVTPNIFKIRGFTVEECLNQKIEESMAPESLQHVIKVFQEEMAIEMSGTGDLQRSRVLNLEEYCKDGSTIWMENVISFVRDKSGKPIGVLAVSRDISERIEAEAEKKRLSEQLIHAQKMESVGTLAGGIAHDFNNLLQVIGGYTSILLSDEERDSVKIEKLKIIEKSVDRASELVSNLLAFSRKNVSMKKKIDLNIEVTSSVTILRRTIPKMVKIKTDLDKSIPELFADPIQIEQIILNLGKNASDAMPDGGTLSIKTEYAPQSGDFECRCGGLKEGPYVMLTLSDTGIGMDKETKENVFDPFFTTKEIGKGTGLGLASVYGIIESHGGHIHCESEPGKGATFVIFLPVHKGDPDEKKIIPEKALQLEGSETILIVDDEENIRELYSNALGEFGYKVLTASNGEEALLIYRENIHMINIVILDLGMPGMGGFKCMLEIKKINPGSKIIIASGYSDVFETEDLIKSGASGFIQKPFKLKNVLEKIRELID